MRRNQRLIQARTRLRILGLLSFLVVLAGAGLTWVVITWATTSCTSDRPCTNEGTAVNQTDWSLVFADEFNDGQLDDKKWNTSRWGESTAGDYPYNEGKEGAWFATSNVVEGGGLATIKLQPSRKTLHGRTYNYSSGEFNSERKFYLTPGTYVESRIRVPKCSGCWPAFWVGPSGQWPPEIDMFEYFNSGIHKQPAFNYHIVGGGETGPTSYGEPRVDYRDSFHVYGMLWTTGGEVIPYLDGKPYPQGITNVSTVPEFLIFNLSTFAGSNPTASQMQVDWVRVWGPPPVVATPTPAAVSVATPSPTPTPLPSPTPTLLPKPKVYAGIQTAIVSGVMDVPLTAGTISQAVTVDGTPAVDGLELQTRWLTNGVHVLTIRRTDWESKTTTVTTHIDVRNNLTGWETVRNQVYAPFHGNQVIITVINVCVAVLIIAGGAITWIIRHRHRKSAVGLGSGLVDIDWRRLDPRPRIADFLRIWRL